MPWIPPIFPRFRGLAQLRVEGAAYTAPPEPMAVNLAQIRNLLLPGLYQIQGTYGVIDTDMWVDHMQDALMVGVRYADGDRHVYPITYQEMRQNRYIQRFRDIRGYIEADARNHGGILVDAEKRAMDLLRTFLTQYQLGQFDAAGWFETLGRSGKLYRIHGGKSWPDKNVSWMQNGKKVISYCAFPLLDGKHRMAMGDGLLAQKLALETDDDKFTRTACSTLH